MEINKELSKFRIEQAEKCLAAAKLLLNAFDYGGATNRSYYCIFHSMRSLLALEKQDFKKHSAVIAHFRQKFIKTKTFDKRLSEIITDLFQLRAESDYEDFFVIEKQEVVNQVENAEYFLNEIKSYLDNQ